MYARMSKNKTTREIEKKNNNKSCIAVKHRSYSCIVKPTMYLFTIGRYIRAVIKGTEIFSMNNDAERKRADTATKTH